MTKLTFLMGLALLAVCPMMAQAQMPDPTVYDTSMAYYDIGALKAGDWVEVETVMMGGSYKTKAKTACVGVEGDTVWIEVASPYGDGTMLLYGVNKGDRKITKAYWGKPGEVGKELKVQPMPGGGVAPTSEKPKQSGTVKVSTDKIKVGDQELECEKIESEITTESSAGKYTGKMTMWYSEKVPFKYFIDEKAEKTVDDSGIKYEGKPSYKGGVAKMISGEGQAKSETNVIGFGTDAKQTVKTK